jgi:hypothetical protein
MKILAALLLGLLCSSLGFLADAGMEAFYDHTPEVERPGYVLVLDAFTPVTWWLSWMVGALVAFMWGTGRHNFPVGCHLTIAVTALMFSIVLLLAANSMKFLIYMNGPRDVPLYRIGVNVLIILGLSIASYRSIVTKSAEKAGSSNGG